MRYDIQVINPASNIAISTLWTRKEAILSRLKEEIKRKIGIIGTTYTFPGILHILKTLGEHPRIDTLIIFGADLSDSGNGLVRVFGEKEIIEPRAKPIIETVKLIDMRGRSFEDLERTIEEHYREGEPVRPFVRIDVEERVGVNSYIPPLSGHLIYDTSIYRAWKRALGVVMEFGTVKGSQYGELQKEFMNMLVVLGFYGNKYELERELEKEVGRENLEKHVKEVLSSKKPPGVSYTYGERLENQVDYMVETLSKYPDSRRAVACLWKDSDRGEEQPPCLVFVEGLVSEGYYHHTAIFRSHDMYAAWPINVYAQYKLMESISEKLGVEVGTLTILSISAHVYQHDWAKVRNLKVEDVFVEDPKGNYVIYRDGNRVVVEHWNAHHRDLLSKQYFDSYGDAYEWLRKREGFTLFSHALYLGREIWRAFKERDYEQDRV